MYYEMLTEDEKLLVQEKLSKKGKNVYIALILVILFGFLGVHKFYLGESSGFMIMSLTLTSVWGFIFIFGIITLLMAISCVLLDLFTIASQVNDANYKIQETESRRLISISDNKERLKKLTITINL